MGSVHPSTSPGPRAGGGKPLSPSDRRRRVRRALAQARQRRARAWASPQPTGAERLWRLARLEAEVRQLAHEVLINWDGEPGQGPPEPTAERYRAMAARPGEPPRELIRLLAPPSRPWRAERDY